MQEIERSIEDLVSSTHAKQNWSGGVVQSNDGVAALPHELVTSLALKKTSVEMNPMATHINGHRQLEKEKPIRVECAQRCQETHGSTTICKHVQHGSKLGRLVQGSCSMTVKGIQEPTEKVTPTSSHVVGGHEPEAEEGQKYAAISN